MCLVWQMHVFLVQGPNLVVEAQIPALQVANKGVENAGRSFPRAASGDDLRNVGDQ
jgi:hypothetical protein